MINLTRSLGPALRHWPMTKKLSPITNGQLNRRNLLYLMKIAAVTRLAIGAVRVMENHPDKLQGKDLSPGEKKKSFYERLFVEIFGTVGYLLALHFGEDLTAKFYEWKNRHALDKIRNRLKDKLAPWEFRQFEKEFTGRFGAETHGMMYRIVNGQEVFRYGRIEIERPTLDIFKKRLGPDLFKKVEKELVPFVERMNRAGMKSIFGGVLLGAFFGGYVIQKFNDQVLSPLLTGFFRAQDDVRFKREQPASPFSAHFDAGKGGSA